jgi:type VI secretion system protein ImpB
MSANEMQHWLDRNRPPRVQITYDVETLGSAVKQEIPFVVGVIGDFAGGPRPASPLAKRTFVEIDRDNFTQVMDALAPSLTLTNLPGFRVDRTPDGNTYACDDESFPANLTFTCMDDFKPPAIIAKIPKLQALMEIRCSLRDLVAKLGTTPLREEDRTAIEAAVAKALNKAREALKNAVDAVGDARKKFDDAAAAVETAETDDARKQVVTKAKAAVPPFTATPEATADDSDATKVNSEASELWTVAAALRDAMQTLRRTAAGYDGASATEEQKTAYAALEEAVADDTFVREAGAAALQGASALALNPAPAQAPAQKS